MIVFFWWTLSILKPYDIFLSLSIEIFFSFFILFDLFKTRTFKVFLIFIIEIFQFYRLFKCLWFLKIIVSESWKIVLFHFRRNTLLFFSWSLFDVPWILFYCFSVIFFIDELKSMENSTFLKRLIFGSLKNGVICDRFVILSLLMFCRLTKIVSKIKSSILGLSLEGSFAWFFDINLLVDNIDKLFWHFSVPMATPYGVSF